MSEDNLNWPTGKEVLQTGRWDLPDVQSELSPARGSLSGLGSEILIAQWEARADQCERTHEQFKSVLSHMLSCYQEKARAYRAAAEDLRRQMRHESKRQPTENAELCSVRKTT